LYYFKKIFILTIGLLFSIFAVIQINDPDPFIWIIAYSIPALFSFSLLLDITSKHFQWMSPIYLIYGFYLFTNHKETEVMFIFNETINEIFGLILCAVWMFILPRLKTIGNS
tara:strand:- start:98 stop:433 length:336 start_codon:yes stop_codon:yes gene_type:complete